MQQKAPPYIDLTSSRDSPSPRKINVLNSKMKMGDHPLPSGCGSATFLFSTLVLPWVIDLFLSFLNLLLIPQEISRVFRNLLYSFFLNRDHCAALNVGTEPNNVDTAVGHAGNSVRVIRTGETQSLFFVLQSNFCKLLFKNPPVSSCTFNTSSKHYTPVPSCWFPTTQMSILALPPGLKTGPRPVFCSPGWNKVQHCHLENGWVEFKGDDEW